MAYEPGPFSEITESSVEAFVGWYLDRLRDAADEPRRVPATSLVSTTTT